VRISDYALIGDCRTAALVSLGGSIDWLCLPRFDSPSLFAKILDEQRGGSFSIAPTDPEAIASRAYLGESNVLRTRFVTGTGELSLTDFMPVLSHEDAKRCLQPEHEVLRIAKCERGTVEVEVIFDPRPNYGSEAVTVKPFGKLGLRAHLPAHAILHLNGSHPLPPEGRARYVLHGGEELHYSLSYGRGNVAVIPPLGARSHDLLERTTKLWQSWAARTKYDGPSRELVVRSALVLKALQFAPSGAIIAAPTTSLPERPGGKLNWDYRYCWMRDAALTSRALFGLGHREEAQSFLNFLLSATNLSLPKLHVLYDLFGRKPPPERELPHLAGHGGARPVRVGNEAMNQTQLDVYGEVIEAAAFFVRSGGEIDRSTSRVLSDFGKEVVRSWNEPDAGIWEVRGEEKNFTHSRALCWSALQRLTELGEKGHIRKNPKFAEERDRIRTQIESRGYNQSMGSYTQAYGGDNVDVSLLLLPWYGYRPADSPRMLGTWRRIQRDLGMGDGLFKRYEGHFTEGEGSFGICNFWATEYVALGGGTLEEAMTRFTELLGYANDVGLFGEEIEAESGDALGNFPQAYTHVGLINAALSITARMARGKSETPKAVSRTPPEAHP
jgi:GH15 family glucan-1,4-alpha-glucosidase